jgi:hypothetical protein
METLNNTLPVEERLEPFVWTTGWVVRSQNISLSLWSAACTTVGKNAILNTVCFLCVCAYVRVYDG